MSRVGDKAGGPMTAVEAPKDAVGEAEHDAHAREVVAVVAGLDRDRHPPASAWWSPCGDLDHLQHPLGRRLPDRPQPLEPLGPEHVDRDHGDGHGPDHRVAQHRPLGRVAARLPRLHDGPGPDRRHVRVLRPRRDRRRPAEQVLRLGRRARSSASCSAPWSAPCRASSSPTSASLPSSSPSAASSSGAAPSSASGDKQGQTLAPLDATFQLLGGGAKGSLGEWRSWVLALLALRRHRRQHLPRTTASPALRPRRPPDVGRRRSGRRRLRGRHRRRRAGRQPLHVADHRQGHRRRVPGGDPDRRDAADELPRPAPSLRSLRVRLRRQPGGGRAERHQHPPHGHAHVRPHGRPVSR